MGERGQRLDLEPIRVLDHPRVILDRDDECAGIQEFRSGDGTLVAEAFRFFEPSRLREIDDAFHRGANVRRPAHHLEAGPNSDDVGAARCNPEGAVFIIQLDFADSPFGRHKFVRLSQEQLYEQHKLVCNLLFRACIAPPMASFSYSRRSRVGPEMTECGRQPTLLIPPYNWTR